MVVIYNPMKPMEKFFYSDFQPVKDYFEFSYFSYIFCEKKTAHLMYLSPNQLPNKQNHIYLNQFILLLLTLMHPIVLCVYICCSLQIPLQSKQIALTFVALDFFRFVAGPTLITDLKLITCYISLCTVPLDPKSKFMNIITIQ